MSKKKNRLITVFVILIIISCSLIVSGIILQELQVEEELPNNSGDIINEQLWQDYQNGKISTDEYVKYNLYTAYDSSLLPKIYSKSNNRIAIIHVEDLINKYYNELFDDTLRYFAEKINLANVTFELDKENTETNDKVTISDLLIEKVDAKSEKVTNLNKAILSSNGNFVVWYTTTGDSATSYEAAKKIADGLEATVSKYDELSSNKFKYVSNVISKGNKYQDQVEILKNSNIDVSYLENAMPVYLINYDGNSLASYLSGYGIGREIINKIFGSDPNGAITFPYILIKPSSFSDFESLEQLYNHELFHHYQKQILCGSDICEDGGDPYILEATANWASSIVSINTKSLGFLNDWAGTARKYASTFMSNEFANQYGTGSVGYAMFVYLSNYASFVSNGTEKIVQSIYESNSCKYLNDNAYNSELEQIQKNIVLKNLSQDYDNNNLLVSKNYGSGITVKKEITGAAKIENIELNRIAIDYYQLKIDNNSDFEITLKGNNISSGQVYAYIIAEQNNTYEIINSSQYYAHDHIFENINSSDYDNLYLAIANISLTTNYNYSFEVEKGEILQEDEVLENDEILNNDDSSQSTNLQYKIGDEVRFGSEVFIVYKINKASIKMIAKYNLYVGAEYTSESGLVEYDNPTGLQSSEMLGMTLINGEYYYKGVVYFSDDSIKGETYASYVGSKAERYVAEYGLKLKQLGCNYIDIGLISFEELKELGCDFHSCQNAPSWIWSTSYFTSSPYDDDGSHTLGIYSTDGKIYGFPYWNGAVLGIRPVIEISIN